MKEAFDVARSPAIPEAVHDEQATRRRAAAAGRGGTTGTGASPAAGAEAPAALPGPVRAAVPAGRERAGAPGGSAGSGKASGPAVAPRPRSRPEEPGFWARHHLAVLTAATLACLLAGVAAERLGAPPAASLFFYVASYLAGGTPAALSGLAALRQRVIDVDLLMVLAALGAAGLGAWEEGATLLFLFSLSNALQSYAMDRTRRAIRALMDLAPETARRLRPGGTEEEVPVEDLRVGDVIAVRPGERIPIDGRVRAGRSTVDQAAITGESVPVAKGPGDEVFAGTMNQLGGLEVEVTRPATDTMLARIVALVQAAQEDRSRTQRLIDRIEQVYATAVVAVAALAAGLPLLWGADPAQTIYRALVLMVVASPCAVAISAPAPVLSAVANAARRGILLKGGRYVEELASVRVVAFDKTGTLTRGEPRVTDVVPLGGATREAVLQAAATAERLSEHPLARAVLAAAAAEGITPAEAADAQAEPGFGVAARSGLGLAWAGSPEFARRHGADPSAAEPVMERLAREGKTVLLTGVGPNLLGCIAVQDTPRPGAREAVAALRRAGLIPVMLTGDRPEVARVIAAQLGITEVRAGLLPEGKLQAVEELSRTLGPVAMVGDGVNDAPALARARVGIAMGAAGTDVALETADVVLVSDEIEKLPFVFDLARRATRTIWQNLVFALSVIVVLVSLTLVGRLELALGVLGHEGSTVLAMLNGLRMLAVRPATHGAAGPAEDSGRTGS
ncbi:cadmium-translocating P-type ATPase [Thermaerobacter sp. PB12/4term]|uniref:heavy metal translocating P-type ATPase n=1 Tax=Thermaerobacter sp. PB12/4term TaxID=2293838 RepID=UPI000E32A518|nr:heavy metal translocating P-type ATPase [Thermaerobacter sp. PB12/4term]QIA26603.1 cadmium-translocating P-type ATPase [Thermaerobacter sp. PB12/4term]